MTLSPISTAKSSAPSLISPADSRAFFPILQREISPGVPLVYLDNAATTQRPQPVIDAVVDFLNHSYGNIHRGVHRLSVAATEAYDQARHNIANFINSPTPEQVIFTSGTTQSINLVAASWGEKNLRTGDEIAVPISEHHANFVPWQLLGNRVGCSLRAIPITESGEIDLPAALKILAEPQVKLLALGHASNALGTIHPVAKLCTAARQCGVTTMIDGAQAIAHGLTDVQAIGCDFYAFSGHKMFAPGGTGVLWARAELLEKMPPYQGGGDMIERVDFSGTTFRDAPERFEAGTPNIEGFVGLGAAVDFLEKIDMPQANLHEKKLREMTENALREIPEITLYGTASEKVGVVSFTVACVHPHDFGSALDSEGIAIRVGHHCAQPLMSFYGISGTARASFSIYNTEEEVEQLISATKKAIRFFA